MNPELIKALASLWPIVLMLFVSGWGIYFRKPLLRFFERITNIQLKRGQTELVLTQNNQSAREIIVEALTIEETAGEKPPEELEKKETLQIKAKTSGNGEDELWDAYILRDLEKLKNAYEKLQESELDSKKKLDNELLYYYLSFNLGDTSALTKIESFIEHKDRDIVRQAYYALGLCYESVNNYEKALHYFDLSEQFADKQESLVRITIESADCLFALDRVEEAYRRITSKIEDITEPKLAADLYKGLASLYEKKGNFEFQAFALEKALENQANDTSLLFSVAYAHSKQESRSSVLSLLHYKTLLLFTPNHLAALNNIGVQYELLELPIRSVEHYRKAEALDHTLSAANLAYKLMNAGFVDEASKLLDKAKQQADVHPNVGSAQAALSQKVEAESKTEEKRLTAARSQQRFILHFADAYFIDKPDAEHFTGTWQLNNSTEITITQSENLISSQWTEGDKNKKLYGSITNQAAQITIQEGTYYSASKRGYAYLSEDRQEMYIMLLNEGESSFIDLKRLNKLIKDS